METSYIHSFLVLAETLSFAQAAQREHISQSALTRRIQVLEKELGLSLFDRNNRNVQLTESGQEFYFQASKFIEQLHLSIELTQKAVEGYSRRLRIGIGFYEHFFLTLFIQDFLACYPHIKISLYQFTYEQLMEHFIKGNLDIILTSDQFISSISHQKIHRMLLWDTDWAVAISTENPLAIYPVLSRQQLKGQNIITMYAGSNRMIRNIYRNQDFEEASSVIQVNSFEAKLILINANAGIGFVPSFIKTDTYPNVTLRKIQPAYKPRKFYLLSTPQAQEQVVKTFFTLCKEKIDQYYHPQAKE